MKREDCVGFDKIKVERYKCHKFGHFARKCRGNVSQQSKPSYYNRNKHGNSSQALVSQKGQGFDWSDQAEEALPNQALMAKISDDTEIPTKVQSKLFTKACFNTVKKRGTQPRDEC